MIVRMIMPSDRNTECRTNAGRGVGKTHPVKKRVGNNIRVLPS